jgi:hypothetical protein
VTLFSDRTCQWDDISGRQEFTSSRLLDLVALVDRKSEIQRTNELLEHSVTTSIDPEAQHLILRKIRFEAQGYEITDEMIQLLDLTLERIFWREVNPHIWKPMTRA